MVGSSEGPRSQTIVRRVLSADGSERFCVLHEAPQPHCNAFLFAGSRQFDGGRGLRPPDCGGHFRA